MPAWGKDSAWARVCESSLYPSLSLSQDGYVAVSVDTACQYRHMPVNVDTCLSLQYRHISASVDTVHPCGHTPSGMCECRHMLASMDWYLSCYCVFPWVLGTFPLLATLHILKENTKLKKAGRCVP